MKLLLTVALAVLVLGWQGRRQRGRQSNDAGQCEECRRRDSARRPSAQAGMGAGTGAAGRSQGWTRGRSNRARDGSGARKSRHRGSAVCRPRRAALAAGVDRSGRPGLTSEASEKPPASGRDNAAASRGSLAEAPELRLRSRRNASGQPETTKIIGGGLPPTTLSVVCQ